MFSHETPEDRSEKLRQAIFCTGASEDIKKLFSKSTVNGVLKGCLFGVRLERIYLHNPSSNTLTDMSICESRAPNRPPASKPTENHRGTPPMRQARKALGRSAPVGRMVLHRGVWERLPLGTVSSPQSRGLRGEARSAPDIQKSADQCLLRANPRSGEGTWQGADLEEPARP